MSQTIDSKVVELQFNNENFERNASTSLSTLEKLKQALNFGSMTRGLDSLDKAVSNVGFSGMSAAIDTVNSKFSAMEVIAFGALTRIGQQAVNVGERLIKSMTIDQVSAGWDKFGQKTQSVATLVAQGYKLETVTEQLERLNWFTDETSYNFTDMVENISKFTAAGQELEPSVTAMEGIATWAALSGQNATTASRAMYQLSQAMGKGTLRLDDYKSIQNASMDTQEFRQKCLDAAVALGTLKKNSDDTYQALGKNAQKFSINQFAERLTKDEWLTSDVMMEVFNQYSSAVNDIYEYAEEHGITASEAIEALGGNVDEFGLKAFKAAQEARTFGDVIDSIKDAASTSWMNIFESVIGDYEQATKLWTDMANEGYDLLVEPINQIGELIKGAMGFGSGDTITLADLMGLDLSKDAYSGIKKALMDVAKAHGISIDRMIEDEGSFEETLKKGWLSNGMLSEALEKFGLSTDQSKESLEDFHKLATEVIRGDWGDDWTTRIQRLTEAGYSEDTIQKARDYVNVVHKITDGTWNLSDAVWDEADARLQNADNLAKLSDAELVAQGYTKKEIVALRQLQKQAEENGVSISDLIDEMHGLSGREMLIASISNAFHGLLGVLGTVGEAWSEVFPPITSEQLYFAIKGLYEFSKTLTLSEENADRLKSTFKGFFSILNLANETVKSFAKNVGPELKRSLGLAGTFVLRVTGAFGGFLSTLSEFVINSGILDRVNSFLGGKLKSINDIVEPILDKLGTKAENFFKKLGDDLPEISKKISDFTNKISKSETFKKFSSLFSNLSAKGKEFYKVFAERLSKKLPSIRKSFSDAFKTIGNSKLAKSVKKTFGGMLDGLNEFVTGFDVNKAADSIFAFGDKIGGFFSNIFKWIFNSDKTPIESISEWFTNTFGDISLVGALDGLKENIKSLFTDDFGNINITEGLDAIKNTIENWFKDVFGDIDLTEPYNVLKDKIKAKLDEIFTKSDSEEGLGFIDKLKAIKANIEAALGDFGSFITEKITTAKDSFLNIFKGVNLDSILDNVIKYADKISKVLLIIEGLGIADNVRKLIKNVQKIVGSFRKMVKANAALLRAEAFADTVRSLAIIIGVLVAAVAVLGYLPPNVFEQGLKGVFAISGIIAALIIIKGLMDKLNGGDNTPGSTIGDALEVLFNGVSKALKRFATLGGIGVMVSGIGIGILAIAGALFLLTQIDWSKSGPAVTALVAIAGGIFAFCVILAKINNAGQIGLGTAATILALAIGIKAMVSSVKSLGKVPIPELAKGLISVGLLLGAMVFAIKGINKVDISGKGALKILAMAVSIRIMVNAVKSLGNLSLPQLIKGVGGIAGLLFSLAGAMKMLDKVDNSGKGALKFVALAAAVGILTLAVKSLSNLTGTQWLSGVGGVVALILGLAGAMKLIDGTTFGGKTLLAIGVMTAVVFVLSEIVKSVADIPVANALTATFGLSALLLSLAGAFKIFSTIKIEEIIPGLLASLVAVGLFVGLVELIGAMSRFIPGFRENAEELADLVGGSLGKMFGAFKGELDASYLKHFCDGVNDINFDDSNIDKAKNLIEFFRTIAGDDSIKSTASGPFGIWRETNTTLTKLGQGAGNLGEGLNGFISQLDSVNIPEGFIENKVRPITDLLVELSSNTEIQSFETGFLGAMYHHNSTLTHLGTGASALGTGIGTLVTSFENVNIPEGFVENKIKPITDLLVELASNQDIQSFDEGSGWFLFVSQTSHHNTTLRYLGQGAANLGEGLNGFISQLDGISLPDGFINDKIKPITDLLVELSSNTDIQSFDEGSGWLGLTKKYSHNKTLTYLGTGASAIGTGLKDFITNLNDVEVPDGFVEKIQPITDLLVELASNEDIKSVEGKVGWFSVDWKNVTLDQLGTGAATLGSGINTFCDEISKVKISPMAMLKAQYVTAFLKSLAGDESIQSYKQGFLGLMLDENTTLSKFGEGAEDLGDGIKNFMTQIAGAELEPSKMDAALSTLQKLADVEKALRGLTNEATGVYDGNDFTALGSELGYLSGYLKTFSDTVKDLDLGRTAVLVAGLPLIKASLENFVSADFSNAETLKEQLETLGKIDVSKLLENLPKQGESIKSAATGIISAFKEGLTADTEDDGGIEGAAKGMLTDLTTAIDNNKSSVETAGEGLITEIVTGFNTLGEKVPLTMKGIMEDTLTQISGKTSSFSSAASALGAVTWGGLHAWADSISNVFNGSMDSAVSTISGYYSSFYSAGSNAAKGVYDGLVAWLDDIRRVVTAIQNEVNKAKNAKSKSEGPNEKQLFSEAPLEELKSGYEDAGKDLSNSLMNAFNSAMGLVTNLIQNGAEIELKVRPVLDMEELNNQVNAGSIPVNWFALNPSTPNIGALNATMNGSYYDATRNDVINAINRLEQAVGNISGDNYNIGGITYDDGSNVANAVKDLVRAVRLERRGYG